MSLNASIASTWRAIESARGVGDGSGVALAHLVPFGDAPAGRAIAVGGIVGAGLVGQSVGADAAREHLGQDFGGIAKQADAGRFASRFAMISSASSMLVARRSR